MRNFSRKFFAFATFFMVFRKTYAQTKIIYSHAFAKNAKFYFKTIVNLELKLFL